MELALNYLNIDPPGAAVSINQSNPLLEESLEIPSIV